jgi:hypothetical protein
MKVEEIEVFNIHIKKIPVYYYKYKERQILYDTVDLEAAGAYNMYTRVQ